MIFGLFFFLTLEFLSELLLLFSSSSLLVVELGDDSSLSKNLSLDLLRDLPESLPRDLTSSSFDY